MLRWLIHGTALISLGLFVLAGWLWNTSYQYRSEYGVYAFETILGVGSENGLCHPFFDSDWSSPDFEWLNYRDPDVGDTYYDNFDWRFIGFGYGYQGTLLSLQAPYWFVCLTMLVMPGVSVFRILKRAELQGHCVECGYDLRGSLDQATCPECGAAFDPELIRQQMR